jgi:hypothetical protein
MTRSHVTSLSILVVAATLLTGCATTVPGTPRAVEQSAAATTPDTATIASVLPDDTELSGIIGERIDEIDPLIGDATDLRDTMIGSEVTESQCSGVISPLERQTYDGEQVRDVAYATLPEATFGALALPSAEVARALFDSFVGEWQQCDGKTVVKTSGTTEYDNAISDVTVAENAVSSVVVMSALPTGAQVRTQRALGVAENVVIDVETTDTGSPPAATATALAELMMAKVAAQQ